MTERGDFSKEFDAIIGGFREEQNDPIVTEVFAAAAQAEAALNSSPDITHATLDDVLAQLNYESQQAELLGNEIIVSGIVRPTAYVAGGDTARTEEVIKAQFGDVGPMLNDETGPYFTVEQQKFVCGNFDIESYSDNDTEPHRYKICLNLNASEADDPTMGLLYTYPSELTVFAPVEASWLKVQREMTQKYPELVALLDTLPLESDDDEQILQALREFRLTIDWSKYRHIDGNGRRELVEMLERYMTRHVAFDTALYSLPVRGKIIGFDTNGYEREGELKEPKQITGYVQMVRLRDASSNEGVSELTPALELYAPAPKRHSGVTLLHLPVESIQALNSLRNNALFGEEMAEYESPDTIQVPEPLERVTEDADGVYDSEQAAVTEYTVEVVRADGRERTERDKQLEALDARIGELFSAVHPYINTLYDTREAAEAEAPKLEKIVRDFMDLYPADPMLVLRAEGEGVQYSKAQLNVTSEGLQANEDGSVQLKFDALGAKQGDIFEAREGMLSKEANIGIISAEVQSVGGEVFADGEKPIKYLLRAYMVLRDAQQPATIALDSHMTGTPLHSIIQYKRFVVDIDRRTSAVTIPAYERIKQVDAAIAKVANQLPDRSFLPLQLHDLYADTQIIDPRQYADLSDPELLQKIGSVVAGDERATQLTVDALGEILTAMRTELKGGMFTGDGTFHDSVTVRGRVTTVVSTVPNIPATEPMLVIEHDDTTWYAPISQLERFRY